LTYSIDAFYFKIKINFNSEKVSFFFFFSVRFQVAVTKMLTIFMKTMNQVNWIQNHVFINVWHSERLGTLLYVIFAEITFWGVVAAIFHKLGIYWKL